MSTLTLEHTEIEALEELFGPEADREELAEEAGDRLGRSDELQTPQAVISTIVWTVRLRC
jgi:hypothetical protein